MENIQKGLKVLFLAFAIVFIIIQLSKIDHGNDMIVMIHTKKYKDIVGYQKKKAEFKSLLKRGEGKENTDNQQSDIQNRSTEKDVMSRKRKESIKLNKKKYVEKFSVAGQERAKSLDAKAKQKYDQQLAKYRLRERIGRKRYRKKIQFLASQNVPIAMEKYQKQLQSNRDSMARYCQKKRIEKAEKSNRSNKPTIKKRKKNVIPDLNKSPPPDLDAGADE